MEEVGVLVEEGDKLGQVLVPVPRSSFLLLFLPLVYDYKPVVSGQLYLSLLGADVHINLEF